MNKERYEEILAKETQRQNANDTLIEAIKDTDPKLAELLRCDPTIRFHDFITNYDED